MRATRAWGLLGLLMAGLLLAGCGEDLPDVSEAQAPPDVEEQELPPLADVEQELSSPLLPRWTRTAVGVEVEAHDVATDWEGHVYVSFNYFGGAASISGQRLPFTGSGNHVGVAKYDRTGRLLWARGFGATDGGRVQVTALAVSPIGNVVLGGRMSGSVNFGGGTRAAGAATRSFLVKLSPGGFHRWSRLTNPPPETDFIFRDLAVDPSGNVVALATQSTSAAPSSLRLMLVGYLGSTGAPSWGRTFVREGALGSVSALELAIDSSRRIYVGGMMSGSVTLGSASYDVEGGAPFVAAFGSRGEPRWSRRIASAGYVGSITAGSGRVALSLYATAGLSFAGGGGGPGSYVAAYSFFGTERWVRATGNFGDPPFLGNLPGRAELLVYGAGSADALGAPRFPSGADTWHLAVLGQFSGTPLRLSRFPAPPGGAANTTNQRGVALGSDGSAYGWGLLQGLDANFGLGFIGPGRDAYLIRMSR